MDDSGITDNYRYEGAQAIYGGNVLLGGNCDSRHKHSTTDELSYHYGGNASDEYYYTGVYGGLQDSTDDDDGHTTSTPEAASDEVLESMGIQLPGDDKADSEDEQLAVEFPITGATTSVEEVPEQEIDGEEVSDDESSGATVEPADNGTPTSSTEYVEDRKEFVPVLGSEPESAALDEYSDEINYDPEESTYTALSAAADDELFEGPADNDADDNLPSLYEYVEEQEELAPVLAAEPESAALDGFFDEIDYNPGTSTYTVAGTSTYEVPADASASIDTAFTEEEETAIETPYKVTASDSESDESVGIAPYKVTASNDSESDEESPKKSVSTAKDADLEKIYDASTLSVAQDDELEETHKRDVHPAKDADLEKIYDESMLSVAQDNELEETYKKGMHPKERSDAAGGEPWLLDDDLLKRPGDSDDNIVRGSTPDVASFSEEEEESAPDRESVLREFFGGDEEESVGSTGYAYSDLYL
jgi:hypothetical protein